MKSVSETGFLAPLLTVMASLVKPFYLVHRIRFLMALPVVSAGKS
jgi:hypothetical protein